MGYLRFFIHHHRNNKYFSERLDSIIMLRGSDGRNNTSATVAPLSLEPWRVEVVLLVEEAPRHYPTSARVQLKLGKRLACLWDSLMKVREIPGKEKIGSALLLQPQWLTYRL
jgi:hypothetical protein